MEPTNNIMRRMEEHRKKESEVFAKIREHGLKVGLILVQTTPRRYQVVKLNHSSNRARSSGRTDNEKVFFTHPTGQIVWQGKHEECVKYIEDHGEALPEDLHPPGA